MSTDDRLWLGGWIALCLGIADDNLSLKLMGVATFLMLIWQRHRADP